MALTDKLTAIADATRAKTGTTEQMTLDEIATAISGISSSKGVIMLSFPTATDAHSSFSLNHSLYSQYVDMNFPCYLVFGCYITGISGICCKIVKVDTNELTTKEMAQCGSSATLYYAVDETKIAIAAGSSSKIKISPGYIHMFGVKK